MKMCAGAPSGIAYVADLLPHYHNIADIYRKGAHMRIKGGYAAAVVNNSICAVAIGIAVIGALLCKNDRSGICGNYLRAVNSRT